MRQTNIRRDKIFYWGQYLKAMYGKEFPAPAVQFDFLTSRRGYSNRLFTSTGVEGILEGLVYSSIDVSFSIFAAFLNRTLELIKVVLLINPCILLGHHEPCFIPSGQCKDR